MGGRIDITNDWVGYKDLTKLVEQSLPKMGATPKIYYNGMKTAAQRTIIPRARGGFRALGKSGSLAQAMRAYRWKAAERKFKFEVHTGPKRSMRNALIKYLAYWRKRVRPATFKYGIRHAHLVEFGHKIKGGGSVPGKHVLERAGAVGSLSFSREFFNSWDEVIQREVRRIMRKKTRERQR